MTTRTRRRASGPDGYTRPCSCTGSTQAAESRMPMDPRIWSEGPIRSTFPACMAVKAAAEQGPEAAERYLRAVREGLMCFRRKLDSAEPLVEVAREAGLDVRRFRVDVQSNAIVEAFGADLEETRSAGRGAPVDPVRRRRRRRPGCRAARPTRSGAPPRWPPAPRPPRSRARPAGRAAALRADGHRGGGGRVRPLEPGGGDGALAAGGGGPRRARCGCSPACSGSRPSRRARIRRRGGPRGPAPAARPRRRSA